MFDYVSVVGGKDRDQGVRTIFVTVIFWSISDSEGNRSKTPNGLGFKGKKSDTTSKETGKLLKNNSKHLNKKR